MANTDQDTRALRLASFHFWGGILIIIAFVLTGQYMSRHFPEIYGTNETMRFMFRANHIYVLMSGLVNIAVGAYLVLHPKKWRRTLQWIGSTLLMIAPVVLILAFFRDPPRLDVERVTTSMGIFALSLGLLAHLPGRQSRKRRNLNER